MSDQKFYLGLGHKARQGKDTAAWAIHHAYPKLTRVMGFADALKAHCRVLGMREKNAPFLQQVGLAYRSLNPDLWIDVLKATASEVAEPVIIIPDVRFPNEAEFVRSNGGKLVRVVRLVKDPMEPTEVNFALGDRYIQYVATDRPADHPSEIALNDFDWDHTIHGYDVEKTKYWAITAFQSIAIGWGVL